MKAADAKNIPSCYIPGYARAEAINPEMAANYIAHTQVGDPEADAVIEQMASLGRGTSARLFKLGLNTEDPGEREHVLRDAPSALRDFLRTLDTPPDWVDLSAYIPGIRMFHRNSSLVLGAFVGGVLVEGFSTNISKSFFITGRLIERLDGDNRRTGIECRLCGRSVEGEEADREMKRMRREEDNNLPKVRRGLPAKYREDAKFVLKILPDMDRDTAYYDRRVAAKMAAGRRKDWLGRHDFPKGTAGHLYLQASAFMAGIENLPREMSVIRYSDYDFQEPRISDVGMADDGSGMHISAKTVGKRRQLPDPVLMQRMGLLMMSGMTAAFACELALKAILITRLDEARKSHDLLELYRDLPEDSKARLKADFTEIEDELGKGRHTFGNWRYFESNVGDKGMMAMVNTERAFALAKVARVIIDEGEIAGLKYEVDINFDSEFSWDNDDTSYSEKYGLEVTGVEAPIPWDLLLKTGRGKQP